MAGGDREGRRATAGLLVVGGEAPPAGALRDAARGMDLVGAADSGLVAALAAGLVPDIVVGDMDSLPDRALLDRLPADRLFVYPVDKDETDTEIGMRLMRARGCTSLTLAGGGGGRLDHLLGLVELFERPDPPRRWIIPGADVHLVEGEAEFHGWEGSTVSVFPLGAEARGLSSEGLRWPLDGLSFRRGWAGISNRVSAARVRVGVREGRLLVVRVTGRDA